MHKPQTLTCALSACGLSPAGGTAAFSEAQRPRGSELVRDPHSQARVGGWMAPKTHICPSAEPGLPVFPGLPPGCKSIFWTYQSDLLRGGRLAFWKFCSCFWAAFTSRTAADKEEKPRVPAAPTFHAGPAAGQTRVLEFVICLSTAFTLVPPGARCEGQRKGTASSTSSPRPTPSHHSSWNPTVWRHCFPCRSPWVRTVLPGTPSEALTSHPSDSPPAKLPKKTQPAAQFNLVLVTKS